MEIDAGDGDDTLNVEQGGLLVASYVGMLPSEYDLYKNNCKGDGNDSSSCFRAIPKLTVGVGANEINNDGVIVGTRRNFTGNFLEIVLRLFGCLSSRLMKEVGMDSKGRIHAVMQQTVGGKLPKAMI